MGADPERQECVVAFKEVWFNMMGSQSRAGEEGQDMGLKGPTSSLLQPQKPERAWTFTMMAIANPKIFKQQSALVRVFYKSHLRVALRMESVKDGKSGGRETTQGAVAVIQVRADNCLADKSCLTFPDSTDSSPSGSSVPGISQARILEWAAISFSRESSQSSDHNHNSCMAGRFFTTEPPENAQRWLLVIESLSHV